MTDTILSHSSEHTRPRSGARFAPLTGDGGQDKRKARTGPRACPFPTPVTVQHLPQPTRGTELPEACLPASKSDSLARSARQLQPCRVARRGQQLPCTGTRLLSRNTLPPAREAQVKCAADVSAGRKELQGSLGEPGPLILPRQAACVPQMRRACGSGVLPLKQLSN